MRKSSDSDSSIKSTTISSSPRRANNDLQQQRPCPFRSSPPFRHSMFLPSEVHRSLTSRPRALTGCRCAVSRGLVLTS
ncbi:unnamed protein product [Sphagnum jensenii]